MIRRGDFGDLGLDGRVLSRRILKRLGVALLTGFVCTAVMLVDRLL